MAFSHSLPPRSTAGADRAFTADKLPQVDSYYDKVHQASWIGRTAGLWAGVGGGSSIGLAMGAAASFLPALITGAALPGAWEVGTAAAAFGGVGAMMGVTIFADVGVTASAVAAGFEERERRDKLEKLREHNPELAAKLEQESARAIVQHNETPTSLPARAWKTVNKFINPKVMLTGIVLGAGVGAMFGMAKFPFMENIIPASAAQAGTSAFVAASAATIGILGAVFGLKMSYISNLVTNFTHRILSGKAFESESPTPEKEKAAQLSGAISRELEKPSTTLKDFAPLESEVQRISYREFIREQSTETARNR